jgi:fermentation-respiration switch protein FrsA (DUF1100 family)
LGFIGSAVTPTLIEVVAPRIGVDPERLRPIDAISKAGEPLLLLAGTEDQYTHIDEARALFARARSSKEMWEVQGAGHQDLHEYSPLEYERRVGGFLVAHLRQPTGSTEPSAATASGATRDLLGICRADAVERRDCR